MIPSLDSIIEVVGSTFIDSQMEFECIVVVLVYIKRLLRSSRGQFVLLIQNWEDVFLSCCVLSNKVWDDFHMTNADYCHIVDGLTLKRVNEIEISLLNLIEYRCNVSPNAYARYESKLKRWNWLSTSPPRRLQSTPTSEICESSNRSSSSRLPHLDEHLLPMSEHEIKRGHKDKKVPVPFLKGGNKVKKRLRTQSLFDVLSGVFSQRNDSDNRPRILPSISV